MFTESPIAVYDRSASLPTFPTIARPVLTPTRNCGHPAAAVPSAAASRPRAARQRAARVIGLRDRCAEEGHHRVAREHRDRASLTEDGRHDGGEVHVQHVHHLGGRPALGEGREAAEVGVEHRDLAIDPTQRRQRRLRHERGGDVGRQVRAEQPVQLPVEAAVVVQRVGGLCQQPPLPVGELEALDHVLHRVPNAIVVGVEAVEGLEGIDEVLEGGAVVASDAFERRVEREAVEETGATGLSLELGAAGSRRWRRRRRPSGGATPTRRLARYGRSA